MKMSKTEVKDIFPRESPAIGKLSAEIVQFTLPQIVLVTFF